MAAPKAGLGAMLVIVLGSKLGYWRSLRGHVGRSDGVLKASWHRKPLYDAVEVFTGRVFVPLGRPEGS